MRLYKLRKEIEKIDGFIITNLPNIYYLTGFTGSSGALVVTQKDAIFFTDFRYKEQSAREVKDAETFIVKKSLLKDLIKHPVIKSLKKIGIEENISYSTYLTLKRGLKHKKIKVLKSKVEEIRKIKEPNEIELIKKAAKIANSIFDDIVHIMKPGVKERDIAIELEYRFKKSGAEGTPFETIIASGPNAALPHARAANRKLKDGDTIVCDFGVIYNHYASDTSRTLILGENPKAREIYKIVKKAQETAIKSIKPDIALKEVDKIARKIITDTGYGKYFGHGLGHGVGLLVHEAPTVSRRSKNIAKPGMIFTIEPGIYLPQFGGVRIEDMVAVTKSGAEVITHFPK